MLWNPVNADAVTQEKGSVVRSGIVPNTVLLAVADTVSHATDIVGTRLADVLTTATGLVQPITHGTVVKMVSEPAINNIVYLSATVPGRGTVVPPTAVAQVLGICYEKNNSDGAWYASILPVSDSEWQNYNPVITLVGGAGNVVPQYVTNSGRFYRKGKIVFIEIWFNGPSGNNGAGSGNINVSLPIPAGAGMLTDYKPGGHFHNGASETLAHVEVSPGATTLALYQQTSATQTSAATGSDQNNAATRTIRLSFFYEID